MYDFLEGRIVRQAPTGIVLLVGGIGFDLAAPLSTTSHLRQGDTARIFTWLLVREDQLKLYGFRTEVERAFFAELQRVNGIGPSLALALLSRAQIADMARAIVDGSTAFLQSLKGIGPKTAQRLVTELRDRVQSFLRLDAATESSGAHTGLESDAVAALEVLGCPPKSARAAVVRVLEADADASIDDVVRRALKLVWPN